MKDFLLYNAHILTMDAVQPVATALAVRNGRLLAVGSDATVRSTAGDTHAIDMDGALLVPGFNDCHMHVLPYGLDLAQANLSPAEGVTDVPSLLAALRVWVTANPQSEWALGNRYDQNTFPGAAHPTRAALDTAFPEQPVFLMQTSKHAGTANSAALKRAGITRETPNPDGGEIVRDAAGEPTGVLLESAVGLVMDRIPRPDKTGMTAAIRRANDALVREGITSASDMNTGWFDISTEVECYRAAAEQGAPVRTTLFPHIPEFGSPDAVPPRADFAAGFGSETAGIGGVRLGAAKLFADGALTVRTAALRTPYVDGSGSGMLLHPPDELKAYIAAAHRGGWQIAIHAIGDRAVELVIEGYEAAERLPEASPRPLLRPRIEHAMLVDDDLIARMVRLGVVAVIQPEFLARLGDAYVLGLGVERAERINPTATMQRAGIPTPFSSDCPIVPGAPLDGIKAAFRRVTRTGQLLGAEERVSPLDGLRNYTYWAAYSSFDEAETGSLIAGKRADFVVLDGDFDPAQGITTETLDSLRVVATVVGGIPVYGAERLG